MSVLSVTMLAAPDSKVLNIKVSDYYPELPEELRFAMVECLRKVAMVVFAGDAVHPEKLIGGPNTFVEVLDHNKPEKTN